MAKVKRKRPRAKRGVKNATLRNPIEQWLADAIMLPTSSSGESVTAKDMLAYPPAFHCINKICGHVGMLPLNVYERDRVDDRKKKLAESLAAYWLVKHQPNPLMTVMIFRQTLQAHALWSGNGRAYIKRNMRGEPSGLFPLPPDRCSTVLVTPDSEDADAGDIVAGATVEKWHVLRLDNGQKVPIPDRNVLHIPGLGYDGLQGYSVIDLAREWLGLAKAQNKGVGANFKSGARPGFMLKAPPGVFKTREDALAFLADVRRQHEGVENDGKIGLLTNGIEAQVLQISARESQWQEQRVFSRQDTALWFAVEQMLGDDSSVSYKSLEEKNRAYITNCLLRWLTVWEQECWMKLLTQYQRESMLWYFRFRVDALLRGTTLDRFAVYEKARAMRVFSANDVRELEDYDPIEGGDEYENPNIDTQVSTDKPTNGQADGVTDRLRLLIAGRIREVQQVEANRIKAASESSGNFCEWVETFYSTFADRITATWQTIGLSADSARDYVAESKRQILDVAGRCRQDEFSAEVSRVVLTWGERATQLAADAVGAN